MDKIEKMITAGKDARVLLRALLMALVLVACSAVALRAQEQEAEKQKSILQAGLLEIAGSTSFSVGYQKEGDRETTHLRVTPSLGYFILDPLEVQLRASYIFDNVHESSVTDDRSEGFLFTLGPAYNFRNVSPVLIPYVGFDLGTYYQHLSSGDSSRSDVQLALGLQGGCRWLLTENVGLKVGLQYVHGFEAGNIEDTDFFGFEIGVSLFIPTWPAY